MQLKNLNEYVAKGSKAVLYAYAGVATYFLLPHSIPVVQAVVGLSACVQIWNWYKNRQK